MIDQYGLVLFLQGRVLQSPKYANKESEIRSSICKIQTETINILPKLHYRPVCIDMLLPYGSHQGKCN